MADKKAVDIAFWLKDKMELLYESAQRRRDNRSARMFQEFRDAARELHGILDVKPPKQPKVRPVKAKNATVDPKICNSKPTFKTSA